MTARIQALGTAMPDHYVFKQSEIVEAFFAGQPGWDPAWAEVFAASGVDRRASVVDPSWYTRPRSTADRMREFAPAARKLGAEAARRALEQAGPAATGEVADLLAVTCTGYSGPGLDVHLVDDLGLGDRVQRLAVGHMGCYAALPALRTAAALATASGGRTLVTCVELCTLHVQPPRTREDAVYLALFGDGRRPPWSAPAATGRPSSARPPSPCPTARSGWAGWSRTTASTCGSRPGSRPWSSGASAGSWTTSSCRTGWPPKTSPTGPSTRAAPRSSTRCSGASGLGDAQVARSREVLADGGNRSSATVLFILEQLLASGEVELGQWIVALAFGTGLTLEALLLRA